MAQLVLNVMMDGLMALLLVVTIFYCWKLNKRIRILQDSKSELSNIIRQFDESTQKATRSIGEIHEATSRIAENMQHKIDKANYLADDLQFMIEKGNKIADRMEGGISAGRKRGSSSSREQVDEAPKRRSAPKKERTTHMVDDAESKPDEVDSAKSSLESVLKRMSGRNKEESAPAAPAGAKRKRPSARLRSKAEQELFDALKTGGEV